MTRLRIKTYDGRVERISVADNSTVGDLKEVVAQSVVQHVPATQVRLSLNKKVELEGTAQDTLSTAGICSGDTIWLLPSTFTKAPRPSGVESTKKETAASLSAAPEPLGLPENPADMQETTAHDAQDSQMQNLQQAEQLPEAKTSFPDLLQRVLDSCTERAQGLHPLMLLTVHAVMLETGMQLANQENKCAPPAEALSSCSNVCQLEYALQQQQRPNICQVKYISLGSGMACIAAALNGSKVAMVNLSLTYHLKWQQQQQGSRLGLDTSAFTDLQQLWTELKDGLAMKALAGLHQSAGLPPPIGLLALPAELKFKILALLQAKDLASIGCCCTELRHTAGSDTLWQPLFEQDSAPIELRQYDITQAGRLGWQRVYALRRAEQDRSRRHARSYSRHPHFPMRGTGFFAPPGPPGGISGGDYDRLPQPFLGGTPGMFGGGAGGSSFGGQGPPPSFFLGGSRGTGRAARAAGNFRLA